MTDLSKIEELEPLVVNIVKETGAFDGFVQCAGIVKNLPLINYKYDRLHKIMLVNFYSYFINIFKSSFICKERIEFGEIY